MNAGIERKAIERFVVKDKRARYLAFVSSAATRNKFIKQLPHFSDFRLELFDDIRGDIRLVISERLKLIRGIKSRCYVISDNREIDQRELPVHIALDEVIGYGSAILVFGDAEMIYYEGEPPDNRLLSKILPSSGGRLSSVRLY